MSKTKNLLIAAALTGAFLTTGCATTGAKKNPANMEKHACASKATPEKAGCSSHDKQKEAPKERHACASKAGCGSKDKSSCGAKDKQS